MKRDAIIFQLEKLIFSICILSHFFSTIITVKKTKQFLSIINFLKNQQKRVKSILKVGYFEHELFCKRQKGSKIPQASILLTLFSSFISRTFFYTFTSINLFILGFINKKNLFFFLNSNCLIIHFRIYLSLYFYCYLRSKIIDKYKIRNLEFISGYMVVKQSDFRKI